MASGAAYNALGVSYAVEGAKDQAALPLLALSRKMPTAQRPQVISARSPGEQETRPRQHWLEKAQALHPEDEPTRLLLAWITANGVLSTHRGAQKSPCPLESRGRQSPQVGRGRGPGLAIGSGLTGTFAVEIVPRGDRQPHRRRLYPGSEYPPCARPGKGATHLVWGEYQRLGAQLHVFGQLVSAAPEATQRFSVVADGSTPAIATAAQTPPEKSFSPSNKKRIHMHRAIRLASTLVACWIIVAVAPYVRGLALGQGDKSP